MTTVTTISFSINQVMMTYLQCSKYNHIPISKYCQSVPHQCTTPIGGVLLEIETLGIWNSNIKQGTPSQENRFILQRLLSEKRKKQTNKQNPCHVIFRSLSKGTRILDNSYVKESGFRAGNSLWHPTLLELW